MSLGIPAQPQRRPVGLLERAPAGPQPGGQVELAGLALGDAVEGRLPAGRARPAGCPVGQTCQTPSTWDGRTSLRLG